MSWFFLRMLQSGTWTSTLWTASRNQPETGPHSATLLSASSGNILWRANEPRLRRLLHGRLSEKDTALGYTTARRLQPVAAALLDPWLYPVRAIGARRYRAHDPSGMEEDCSSHKRIL